LLKIFTKGIDIAYNPWYNGGILYVKK